MFKINNIGIEHKRKYEEEKKELEKYGYIDLSNKRDSFTEDEQNKQPLLTDRDMHERVHNARAGYFAHAEGEQDLELKEFEKKSKDQLDSRSYSRQGYLIKKHLNSSDEIDHEEVIEPKEMYVKDRDTQTPIRKVVNEAIQYESDLFEADKKYEGKTKHAKISLEDEKLEEGELEGGRLPFSTIKK